MRAGPVVLGALASALLSAAAVFAQDATPPQPPPVPDTPPDVLGFNNDVNARMTVPVRVGTEGPYRFLVDTGAERTVIAAELAHRLSLSPGRQVRLHSMTGPSDVPTAVIPQLTVSKNVVEDVHAPSLPAANIGAAGMLGVDSLNKQRVVFDCDKKTMTITPSSKHKEYWGPDVIVVTGRSLLGRLILADCRLDGEKITAVVDTGSDVTIGNRALRDRLTRKRKLVKPVEIELMSVTGEKATAQYTSVRQVSLGGMLIENMPIAFAEVHPFAQLKLTNKPAILLGMDALRLFRRVSVDFANREVRFQMPLGALPFGPGRMASAQAAGPPGG